MKVSTKLQAIKLVIQHESKRVLPAIASLVFFICITAMLSWFGGLGLSNSKATDTRAFYEHHYPVFGLALYGKDYASDSAQDRQASTLLQQLDDPKTTTITASRDTILSVIEASTFFGLFAGALMGFYIYTLMHLIIPPWVKLIVRIFNVATSIESSTPIDDSWGSTGKAIEKLRETK